MQRYLYIHLGDEVIHLRYPQWGVGKVIEEWQATLPGGRSFVKVAFEDGKVRIFDNDFRSSFCSYYMGLRKLLRRGD